jgi:UDP-N-acetyl-D-glucosamine dehydrogenase
MAASVVEAAPVRVLIIGQGYVGLLLALRAVEVGDIVTAYDIDAGRVEQLRSGRSHVSDVADIEVERALASHRYRLVADADDLREFDVALITVPTPLAEGVPDLAPIRSAAERVGRLVRPGCLVVLESTTYPGTTDELLAPALEAASGLLAGVDFHVGYSPERIDPGNTEWTLVRIPKIVAGLTPECLAMVEQFYGRLVERTVSVSTTRVAELIKLLENTFRHVNIALVNELAVHAKALGIDIWEAIDATATKPFGYAAFLPGPGVGGQCLPIDPSYLSWRIERQLGVASRFVVTANDVNQSMPGYVVRRVQLGLNDRRKAVKGARILVLGIAYKKNTNDARETPAAGVVRGLVDLGAEVVVHDEQVGPHELDAIAARVPLSADLIGGCDAVVLVTDHDDVDYDLVTRHAAYVFDARNRMRGEQVESL